MDISDIETIIERPRVIVITEALRLELQRHHIRWTLWKGYPVISQYHTLSRVRGNLERDLRGTTNGASADLLYMVSPEYNKQIERLKRSGA